MRPRYPSATALAGALLLVACSEAPSQDGNPTDGTEPPVAASYVPGVTVLDTGINYIATVASFCDGPNRVYVARRAPGDGSSSPIAVIPNDPRCAG